MKPSRIGFALIIPAVLLLCPPRASAFPKDVSGGRECAGCRRLTRDEAAKILGGMVDNVLNGAQGADTINGGGGADVFVYLAPFEGGDTIGDFMSGNDTLRISASGFGGGLVAGQELVAGQTFISDPSPTALSEVGTFLFDTDIARFSHNAQFKRIDIADLDDSFRR